MRRNYLWYQFCRYVIAKPTLRLFHGLVSVKGSEHIPDNKPVLFVPNHQNAFLDALHVVTNTSKFVHFLTRAEPFRNPVLARFFRSVNMLPVYRVRNGFSAIKKNEEIFEECARRLRQNDAVLVFAEASQDQKRRVRPLSKGFTRIAFGAEEKYDWDLDLQVIPVGINYVEHKKARMPVHLNIGEPIPLRSFRDKYVEDEREAAHELKEITGERLRQLTMHVPDIKKYPLYQLLLDDLEPDRMKLLNAQKLNHEVEIISGQIDEKQVEKAKELYEQAEDNGIDLHDFVEKRSWRVSDILLAPAYLYSFVNNILPFQAVRWVVEDYIEDHVFDASAKYLMGVLLLPLFYLLVCFALKVSGAGISVILIYLTLSVLTAPQFVQAKDWLTADTAEKLQKRDPQKYESLKEKVMYFKELREKLLGEK